MKKLESAESYMFFAMLLIVFVCPFIYIKGLNDYMALPQSAFIQVAAIVVSLLFLLVCFIAKKSVKVRKHPLNMVVLFFCVWTLIASLYAHNHYESMDRWMHWAACILMFFVLQQGLTSHSRVFSLLSVIYAAGVLTAVIGIGQHLFQIDFIPQAAPPAATFANKNMASQFITLTFPIGMVLFLRATERMDKWIFTLLNALMIIFLSYTQTRAVWVSVFFELVLMACVLKFWSARHQIKFWDTDKTLSLLIGLVFIAIVINLGPKGFQWQFKALAGRVASISAGMLKKTGDPSLGRLSEKQEKPAGETLESSPLRLAIWKNTIEMIKERPVLGYGLGNHKLYYPKFHARVVKEEAFGELSQLSHVHNDFLQLFAETGAVGVAIALAVLLIFFAVIHNLLRTTRDAVFLTGLGIGVATAGILVNSCFSFPFEMPIPPLILAVYLAAGLSLAQRSDSQYITVSHKWGLLPCAFLIAAGVYLARYQYLNIQCDKYFQQSKIFEKQRNWKAVIRSASKAYSLNPNRKKILSYAARGYIESKEFQNGVDALEQVIKAYPYHMNALLNLGVAYTGLNQPDKSMIYYQRALDIKSDFSKAHINMAGIYMTRNQYEKAVDEFEKALVTEPDNTMALYNLGISQFHLKEYEHAAKTLQRTVDLQPDMVNAQLNLAILYYQHLKQPEKSIPHFKKTLELAPDVQNSEEIKRIIQIFAK